MPSPLKASFDKQAKSAAPSSHPLESGPGHSEPREQPARLRAGCGLEAKGALSLLLQDMDPASLPQPCPSLGDLQTHTLESQAHKKVRATAQARTVKGLGPGAAVTRDKSQCL